MESSSLYVETNSSDGILFPRDTYTLNSRVKNNTFQLLFVMNVKLFRYSCEITG